MSGTAGGFVGDVSTQVAYTVAQTALRVALDQGNFAVKLIRQSGRVGAAARRGAGTNRLTRPAPGRRIDLIA